MGGNIRFRLVYPAENEMGREVNVFGDVDAFLTKAMMMIFYSYMYVGILTLQIGRWESNMVRVELLD